MHSLFCCLTNAQSFDKSQLMIKPFACFSFILLTQIRWCMHCFPFIYLHKCIWVKNTSINTFHRENSKTNKLTSWIGLHKPYRIERKKKHNKIKSATRDKRKRKKCECWNKRGIFVEIRCWKKEVCYLPNKCENIEIMLHLSYIYIVMEYYSLYEKYSFQKNTWLWRGIIILSSSAL